MNKVSIIMNCYNGEKYLHEAISSIISQTYQNWELIFYDNQSTDQSKKIFESFKDKRFFYHYAENYTKLFDARNKALKKTTGDLIAFLDVDDYWFKTKLEKQCEKFKENENLDFVFTKYNVIDEFYDKVKIIHHSDLNKKSIDDLVINYQIGLSTAMFRKNLIQRINFSFDEKLNIIGDFDAFVELIHKVNFLYIDKVLSFYRWHSNNLSTLNHSQELEELEWWIEKRKNSVSKKILKHIKNKIYYMSCINEIKKDSFFKSLKKIIFYKGSKNRIKLFLYLIYFQLKKIKSDI
jgi:glycosyltransferase involved in cell wall biosynthesis